MIPKKRMAIMTRLVMTGRRMNRVVTFIASAAGVEGGTLGAALGGPRQPVAQTREPRLELVEVGVEHGGDEEGHDLRDGESADHHHAKGAPGCGARADTDRDRQ